jgi:two-component system alkaline phosphatase synthesis response regulator PhoP
MNSRILLVEDEETLRDAIKLNLEMEGYEVEEADTGPKALKKIQEQRFNLIILDVMLPEMDGFTVCQKMRMNDTETPVIFLTAKDTSQDKVMGFKHGGDDYLTKL